MPSSRTVVFGGPDAKAYGDAELIRIAEGDGGCAKWRVDYPVSALDRLSQLLGIAGRYFLNNCGANSDR